MHQGTSVHTILFCGTCPILADHVEIANTTILYNGWENFSVFCQWYRPTPTMHMIIMFEIGQLLPQSVHTFPDWGTAQCWLTLWKLKILLSVIMLELPAMSLSPPFHKWHRPAPLIHMITTLQVGILFPCTPILRHIHNSGWICGNHKCYCLI